MLVGSSWEQRPWFVAKGGLSTSMDTDGYWGERCTHL